MKLQSKVERTVDIVEEKFWEQCHNWTGDMDEWEGSKELINTLFVPEEEEEWVDTTPRCELCGAQIGEHDTQCPICGYDFSQFI